MKSEGKKELGAGRVAFLARKEAIKERIETGRTVMSVYRELGAQLGIGYSQFDRYVIKFIRGKPIYEKQRDKPAEGKKETIKRPGYGQPKFTSTENRDDLINPKE